MRLLLPARLLVSATLATAVVAVPVSAGATTTAAATTVPVLPTAVPATPGQSVPAESCPAGTPAEPEQAPVLAHFYIWFTASSWTRAKIDYPAAGRYSSDQTSVMSQQVRQAKAAGIDGFIVSWKSTDQLNSRLAALDRIAAQDGFKLAITYEAQDFNKRPLPLAQVGRDLAELAATYANDPVFHVFGNKPAVALSGTWNYTAAQLRSVTAPLRSKLLILATEKNVKGYERVAPLFDGDLYYWSSADPEHTPGYADKLVAMSNVVHAHCGLWIAPVAPGFDAKAIGGKSVVDRRNGATLRASWQAALATVPDAIGVISWNEFSENTYIEPSQAFGTRYLDTLRDLTHAPPPPAKELDSSEPQGAGSTTRGLLVIASMGAAVGGVGGVALWRRRRSRAGRRAAGESGRITRMGTP